MKMEHFRVKQDASFPNFGSVFRQSNYTIMKIVKRLAIGNRVHFSRKTANWIINEGGNYSDAIKAVKKVELLHRLLRKRIVREVIVWE